MIVQNRYRGIVFVFQERKKQLLSFDPLKISFCFQTLYESFPKFARKRFWCTIKSPRNRNDLDYPPHRYVFEVGSKMEFSRRSSKTVLMGREGSTPPSFLTVVWMAILMSGSLIIKILRQRMWVRFVRIKRWKDPVGPLFLRQKRTYYLRKKGKYGNQPFCERRFE